MKYKFIGKPDRTFPHLVTGQVYDLVVREHVPLLGGYTTVRVLSPIQCPYDSWDSFYENWEPFTSPKK